MRPNKLPDPRASGAEPDWELRLMIPATQFGKE